MSDDKSKGAGSGSSVVLKSDQPLQVSTKQRIISSLNGPLRMAPVIFALIVIWLVFTLIQPKFLSARNLTNLSVQIVNTGIMAIALFLMLLHGELDLSCAASAAVCSAISAMLSVVFGWNTAVCVTIGIATGALIGAIQGWIVTTFKAPAFIITLAGQMALNGVLLLLLKDHNQISLVGQGMSMLTTSYLTTAASFIILAVAVAIIFALTYASYKQALKYKIPTNFMKKVIFPTAIIAAVGAIMIIFMGFHKGVNLAVVLLLVLLALFSYILTQTRFGVHLYGLGASPEAVRRAGISVKTTKWTAFIISGAVIAVSGLVSASRVQSVSVMSIDQDIMMNAIAACVLGGASLAGGRGNVWGILLGSLVMGSLANGMYLLGAETYLRLLIQGVILTIAVILDSSLVNASSKRS